MFYLPDTRKIALDAGGQGFGCRTAISQPYASLRAEGEGDFVLTIKHDALLKRIRECFPWGEAEQSCLFERIIEFVRDLFARLHRAVFQPLMRKLDWDAARPAELKGGAQEVEAAGRISNEAIGVFVHDIPEQAIALSALDGGQALASVRLASGYSGVALCEERLLHASRRFEQKAAAAGEPFGLGAGKIASILEDGDPLVLESIDPHGEVASALALLGEEREQLCAMQIAVERLARFAIERGHLDQLQVAEIASRYQGLRLRKYQSSATGAWRP